jgi:hypothetical protein
VVVLTEEQTTANKKSLRIINRSQKVDW